MSTISKHYKEFDYANPIFTQHYGADPYAMVYDGRVYFYMTADKYEYDKNGEIAENTYSRIKSLYVVSTDDMANFTDHGEITVACDAAAKWAANSWAPAATWKNIDGKDKFFLYFADNGGGIGVLSADSPIGPFTDPIGHGLITRSVPTCDKVAWLFDPAVLMDDDGKAYIYFGGGIPYPDGDVSNPGTARVCKLGDDMVSLDGDPIVIPDVHFLFEDSGIHKFNHKYYYTYCSNFNVTEEATQKYGIRNGEICMMESDSPMGPFVFKEKILENPEVKFRLGGNNHHCVFNFKDQWYITYHARSLEGLMGIEHGYRVTHIDSFNPSKDGSIGVITQGYKGRKQVKFVNPFEKFDAACVAQMAGVTPVAADDVSKEFGCGNMAVKVNCDGDFTQVQGVEFTKSPSSVTVTVKNPQGVEGKLSVCVKTPLNTPIATIDIAGKSESFNTITASVSGSVSGVNDLFFVFEKGAGIEFLDWKFD